MFRTRAASKVSALGVRRKPRREIKLLPGPALGLGMADSFPPPLQTSLGGARSRTGTGATDQRVVQGLMPGLVKPGEVCGKLLILLGIYNYPACLAGPWSGCHGGPNVRLCNAADNPMIGP